MLQEYKIFNLSLDSIDFTNNKIINTINPHSFCVANKDLNFKAALKNSDILLPDGIGIVWAENFLNGNSIKKIAGYDLFVFLMNKLNEELGSVFFLGASEATLTKIRKRCLSEYPNIKFGSYSPPYKEEFSKNDSDIMCQKVNEFNPDVLFIGMTAPKQEKWSHNFKNNLKVRNICAVGAVFDFYAGNIKRSSTFWINLGLEWLPRFLKEPRRLFKRNLISTPKFVFEVLSIKVFGKE
jgi:N-acetylglucosaminyldiphosphoundecaprenol N-acetyl-beta-D-mannosaminyltransferase